ncbi:MAG: type II toxin-antitoxin system RelE family toxin, partial [Methyloceanibacter sp.]
RSPGATSPASRLKPSKPSSADGVVGGRVADYRVTFTRSARQELENLPRAAADRIVAMSERLAAKPRPVGARKLRGATDLWRVRVGHYRIVYAINDAEMIVDVRVVRHRKDVYR